MAEPTYTFPTAGADPTTYTTLDTVGMVHEVALCGQGLMLADVPAGEDRYQRQKVSLNPERLLDGNTPFNQSIERYHFATWADFSGGMSVKVADRENDDGRSIYSGYEINTLYQGLIGPAPDVTAVTTTSYQNNRMIWAGGRLYMQNTNSAVKYGTEAGVSTTITFAGTPTITDLETDGQFGFAAVGSTGTHPGVLRFTTADPGVAWSAIQAFTLSYVGGRMCATYKSTGSTPNVWTTLDKNGAEEVAGGRLILDGGWTVERSTSGQGFVFFPAHTTDKSVIYRWAIGSTNTPSVAWELPPGQIAKTVFWYQGNVMVLAQNGPTPALYRCAVDPSGSLTPFFVTDFNWGTNGLAHSGVIPCERLCGVGKFIVIPLYFVDPGGNDKIQTFVFDLQVGSLNHWYGVGASATPTIYTPGAVTTTTSASAFDGPIACLPIPGQNFSTFTIGSRSPFGTWAIPDNIYFPVVDKASSMDKVFDDVTLVCYSGSGSLDVYYSTDQGANFTLASTATWAAPGKVTVTLNIKAPSLQLALFGASGTVVLQNVELRFHPIGLDDAMVKLPVLCTDYHKGLNNRPLRECGRGRGEQLARWLETLNQTRVKFQDSDYPITATAATTWEVIDVDTTSMVGVYDRRFGRQARQGVAFVTIRKSD